MHWNSSRPSCCWTFQPHACRELVQLSVCCEILLPAGQWSTEWVKRLPELVASLNMKSLVWSECSPSLPAWPAWRWDQKGYRSYLVFECLHDWKSCNQTRQVCSLLFARWLETQFCPWGAVGCPAKYTATASLGHVKLDRLSVNTIKQHPTLVIISAQPQLLLLIGGHPAVTHSKSSVFRSIGAATGAVLKRCQVILFCPLC